MAPWSTSRRGNLENRPAIRGTPLHSCRTEPYPKKQEQNPLSTSPTAESSQTARPSSSVSGEVSREAERSVRGGREHRKRSETKPEAEIGGRPLRHVSGSSTRCRRLKLPRQLRLRQRRASLILPKAPAPLDSLACTIQPAQPLVRTRGSICDTTGRASDEEAVGYVWVLLSHKDRCRLAPGRPATGQAYCGAGGIDCSLDAANAGCSLDKATTPSPTIGSARPRPAKPLPVSRSQETEA